MDSLQQRMHYAIARCKTAEYEEAKIVINQLLKTYKRKKQQDKIEHCLFYLACIAYVRGEMNVFLSHYKELERLQSNEQQAPHFLIRGYYTLQQQQYKLALGLFSNAAAFPEDDNSISIKAFALLSKANCQLLLGDAEHALATLNNVYSKYTEQIAEDAGLFFQFHLNRCDTLLSLRRPDEMRAHLAACEAHLDFPILYKEQARTLTTWAKMYLVKREPNRAFHSLQQALAFFQNFDDYHLHNEIFEGLITCCEMLGKHKQALAFTRRQLQLQDKAKGRMLFL
ncbi:hypothetical protein [Lysinibacillus sp. 54212]|uniref:hypothetical protein n=1 Tax=Lysinibacillus sp. 54212 TaxID=3119829 RepID=UPI002FC64546